MVTKGVSFYGGCMGFSVAIWSAGQSVMVFVGGVVSRQYTANKGRIGLNDRRQYNQIKVSLNIK